MCFNYWILNRNIQKNHFRLPFINITLDEVAGHELHIFMDGYSKYKLCFNSSWKLSEDCFHHTLKRHIHICDDAFWIMYCTCCIPMKYAFANLLHNYIYLLTILAQMSKDHHVIMFNTCFNHYEITFNLNKIYLIMQHDILLNYVISNESK